jgi:hypothetical protein
MMTAHDLIASIFARHQEGVPGHQRRITQAQYDYLRRLIDADEEGGAFKPCGPGEMLWAPSGRNKYVLTEAIAGKRLMLTRLSNVVPSGMGMLF